MGDYCESCGSYIGEAFSNEDGWKESSEQTHRNPVHDLAFFCPAGSGDCFTYGYVRQLLSNGNYPELFGLYYDRIRHFYIDQIQVLQDNDCYYTLVSQACVGIWNISCLLGHIENFSPAGAFSRVLKDLSYKFSHIVEGEGFIRAMEILSKESYHSVCYSDVLYIHYLCSVGLWPYFSISKLDYGVGISCEITHNIETVSGVVIVNPNWFWNLVKRYYKEIFGKLQSGTSPYENYVIEYIKREIG